MQAQRGIGGLLAKPRAPWVAGGLAALGTLLCWGVASALAQEMESPDYRSFYGLDSRLVVWVVAELHLMFAAFVLGVPMFAVITEYIGMKTKDERFDRLAHEFTKLLSAAFSTTASLGGLLAFLLFGLYPKFMDYMSNVFHTTFYIYALLFFGEAFSLYLYYYSWERLKERKGLHISLGVALNVFGTALMFIANSWVTYMMRPSGVDMETGQFVGTTWEAVNNPLWHPINIHRLIANVAFGGLIVGAYSAIKFLGARTRVERAHYDWMGYIGNFIGIAALIPLPFAGYWLGREVYSASPVMGNNMMGGSFSWAFIVQAILIGMLFIGGNFYLWSGMGRIEGAERYMKYIKYITISLIISFAVWLTPHNLPLSPVEQMRIGGQYHPVLKFLGLMPAKNAVINLIILSTFFTFLLYRRGNKGRTVPFGEQGAAAKAVTGGVAAVVLLMLGWIAYGQFVLDPAEMELGPDKAVYFTYGGMFVVAEMVACAIAVALTFTNRGKLAQGLYFFTTAMIVVVVLGVYGFVILEKANPYLRNVAVMQVVMVLSCLILNTTIDIFLFRKAEVIGGIRWGQMPERSQYALILLCVSIVMLMGLMGFIRSGLREDWHIYEVMRDTSVGAYTPTLSYMVRVVGGITLVFLGLVAFVFWLAELGESKEAQAEAIAAEWEAQLALGGGAPATPSGGSPAGDMPDG